MSSAWSVNNNGIGGEPYLSFGIDTTADKDFTQTDLDAGNVACVISGNNEVGMGSAGDKLFGAVQAVSEELDSSDIPVRGSIQARGVKTFNYTGTTPVINQMVEVDGAGAVRQATADTDIAAGGHLARGQVIAVDTTNTTCDVWLG
ncbi:MAG: hypothetical protein P9M15_00920 [Candidatus Electryoneaceae bacterium]|nr:hypothetical protein [Candidatus Electryoneaceae bacterium]